MAKGNFIPTCDHSSAVEALADLFDRPRPFEAPGMHRVWLINEIKTVLAVHGDIWPQEIYGACVIAGIEDAESKTFASG
jgi:hypothetical protein